ncbi:MULTISPECIES: hypothetical protein [Marinomonas]|uniref:DUF4401 domain-containing protein n=1 Tax=Marinomonas arctica TaxID=383750 RepID=A0A7H1J3H8_9GAMM|nr:MULTISPECIES: hypothetical protein [Marinomonas]MCS7486017.1 hypothetical protein [Marinomonas sp. BSi20414]QNT05044.1 hypothetical protein IBG28_15290 [Marinomonas arctica]GGN16551.1 hypothetical protein GCM10011350_01790 [Marinomonas arctica]
MYQEASNTNLLMLLHTAVYPFIAALIVSFVAGKLLRASSYLGYLGGFIVGLSLIHSGLSFPPNQAIDYYAVTIVIGIISLLCISKLKVPAITNSALFLLSGLSFFFLLNPVLKHAGFITSLSWAAASSLIVVCYYLLSPKTQKSYQYETRSLGNFLSPIGLMIVAGSAAPVVSIGGSLLIGQLLGAFAAAMLGYVIVSYLTKHTQHNVYIPALLILGGLITQSHILADIPLHVMLMLSASLFVTPLILLFTNKISHIVVSQVVISGIISAFSLWLIWPESSLY